MSSDDMRKPLGRKAYGSIGHLPNSRLGPQDHSVPEGQSLICQAKPRKGDRIIIQEKLDGSCCAVAKIAGELVPLTRSGLRASESRYVVHHTFDRWVGENHHLFGWLNDGERAVGEWLALAHGTRYRLSHEPFVLFDVMVEADRMLVDDVVARSGGLLPMPYVVSDGPAMTTDAAAEALGLHGQHGAIDHVEGIVYRVEREGRVDFLAKWVRADKEDGKYLSELSGEPEVWNWTFSQQMPETSP